MAYDDWWDEDEEAGGPAATGAERAAGGQRAAAAAPARRGRQRRRATAGAALAAMLLGFFLAGPARRRRPAARRRDHAARRPAHDAALAHPADDRAERRRGARRAGAGPRPRSRSRRRSPSRTRRTGAGRRASDLAARGHRRQAAAPVHRRRLDGGPVRPAAGGAGRADEPDRGPRRLPREQRAQPSRVLRLAAAPHRHGRRDAAPRRSSFWSAATTPRTSSGRARSCTWTRVPGSTSTACAWPRRWRSPPPAAGASTGWGSRS